MVLSKSTPMRIASCLRHVDQGTADLAGAQIVERLIDVGQAIRLRQKLADRKAVAAQQAAVAAIVAVGNAVAAPGAHQALALIEHGGADRELRVEPRIADDDGAA